MSSFSAMMHDKVQLWTTSVRTKAEDLQAGGYHVMKRLSVASDGFTVKESSLLSTLEMYYSYRFLLCVALSS
jgi:hypothetical protein